MNASQVFTSGHAFGRQIALMYLTVVGANMWSEAEEVDDRLQPRVAMSRAGWSHLSTDRTHFLLGSVLILRLC